MTNEEHKALGHVLVGNWGLELGEKYFFNYLEYKIVELMGDTHCWIEKTNPKMMGVK